MAAVASPLYDLMVEDGARFENTSGAERMRKCFAHDDKTASMSVNVTKGVFHCHACHYSGNVITYLKDVRGLTGRDAFTLLQERFGWTMENYRTGYSQAAHHETSKVDEEELKPPTWAAEIYPRIGSQELMRVHEYKDADGKIRHVTARYHKPTEPLPQGRKPVRTLPFVPAPSKGGGWWVTHPKSPQIPPPDRPYAPDEKMPVYGLDVLLEKANYPQVWIAAGEKDADFVNEVPDRQTPPTISIRHGYRTGDPADLYPAVDLEPLRGRQVLIFADPDTVGHKAAKAAAKALTLQFDCTVRIVLPPVPPKGAAKAPGVGDVAEKGTADGDGLKAIRDWAAGVGIRDYVPPVQKVPADAMAETEHFTVLGFTDDQLLVRCKATQAILPLRRAAIAQDSTLIQIAPLSWWRQRSGTNGLSADMRTAFGNALLRAGEQKGLLHLWHGCVGRGAHETEGKTRFNCGNRLLEADGDDLLTRAGPLGDADFVYQAGPAIELRDDDRAEHWAREFYDATSRYRWQSPNVHRCVMGWCVTALIGGCLPFRPHLWIIGPSSTGKTYVLDTMIGGFFGPVATPFALGTEASIAGAVQSDSLPITLDGFDAGHDRDSRANQDGILELLRAATAECGSRTRLTQTGSVNTTRPRFSALVASIDRPALDKVDDSRFVTAQLSPVPVPDWPSVDRGIRAATAHRNMLAVRTRIIRHAAKIRAKALELTATMLAGDCSLQTRQAQTMAALGVGAWFLSGEKGPAKPVQATGEDPWAPLIALMGRPIRAPGWGNITVAETLHRAYFENGDFRDPDPEGKGGSAWLRSPADCKALAREHGFLFESSSRLLAAPKHPALRHLMDGHEHNVGNWSAYLAGLPGCVRLYQEGTRQIVRRSFGGEKHAVVALGPAALRAVGFPEAG